MLIELENKLSESEINILKLREDELSMKKELNTTKNELLTLKIENDQMNQMKALFLNRRSLISNKPFVDLNVVPFEKFQELQKESENKEKLIIQLKESSIETVLEKEKIIYELQVKLKDSKRQELQNIIKELEEKLQLMEEELIKTQNLLALEKEKNERENSAKFNKNIQDIIDIKSKEAQTLLDMITEQDEKAIDFNKKLIEFQEISKKTEKEINVSNSKMNELKIENANLLEKCCDFEAKLILKEKESFQLRSNLLSQSKIFEKEKEEQVDHSFQLEKEKKKQLQLLTELRFQNKALKQKNFDLIETFEALKQKYEAELNEFKQKYAENLDKKLTISCFQKTTPHKNNSFSPHKRTLSQELGYVPTENMFSFMENKLDEASPGTLETKIRFSVDIKSTGNFTKSIKTQKKSLISQIGLFEIPSPELQPLKQLKMAENLSTVEDHQESDFMNDDSPLKEDSKKSISSEKEEFEELRMDLDEYEKENMLLKKENDTMKIELKNLNEKFSKELEVCQKRESQIMIDLQKKRKENLLNLQVNFKENTNKSLQEEIARLETAMKFMQNQFNEEKNFIENEIKELEKKQIEIKMKYAQAMTERDAIYLELKKCQQNQVGKNQNQMTPMKNTSFFDFLFCHES